MKNTEIGAKVQKQLLNSLSLTRDGIGIFDADDILVYTNSVLASMFNQPVALATGMSFDILARHSYLTQTGLKIESSSIEVWLKSAHQLRRSEKFRSFEVDCYDNRWFLVTEHTADDDSILMFCSDITEQKKSTQKLNQLNQQLQLLANVDSLTGVYNRRYFLERSKIELARCIREKKPLSLLMIDLDHFKLVNDNYGHEAGDNVLIHVSNLIRDLLRTYDIFGRLGGEEFAALLPGSTYSNSRGIAERIVSELGESGIMVNSEKIQITTSIGIAEYHNTLGTLEKLIAEADRHLYEAKKEGRNQVKGC